MRILEIISPSNIGGAENYVVNLSKKLIGKNHEVFIITSNNEAFKDFLKKNGLSFYISDMFFKFDILSILKIAHFVKKHKIDIIHTHLSKANVIGALAGRISNIKSVSTAHGINKKGQYIYSDKVICVSKAVVQNLASQGVKEDRLCLIYGGIDINKFNSEDYIKRDILNNDIDLNIGMVSRLSREKGVNYFIEAAAYILENIQNIKFFIAGIGELKEKLIEQSKKLGIDSRVYFVGFVEEKLASFLNELDILIFPSIKEGLGLSLLEAMAMKKCVIVSKAGGMPEVVEDEKNGFIVDIGNVMAIKDTVIKLNNDRELITAIGEEAKKTVINNFTLDLMTDNIEKLFGEMIIQT
jgi:glycosyltransferase involved in cell wall biosynthesis